MIVDEIDRVLNTDGLASFLKSTSSAAIKFILVGIAHNVSTLLRDHESLERIICPVEVGPMSSEELHGIITLVEAELRNNDLNIVFEEDARERLVKSAAGLPWFVHILGQEALTTAYDSNQSAVTQAHVDAALTSLTKNRFARPFEDRYLIAVGDSRPREYVMRLFAKWEARDIPTSEIYPVAHSLDVSNPSVYVKELLRARNGKVLAKAPFRESGGIYSFTNAMFKRYVQLRPSVYGLADEQVVEAWKKHRGED